MSIEELISEMGAIYCLYSTEDFQPRYVGQTTNDPKYRFKRHTTSALEYEEGVLYDWMREVWRKGDQVDFYELQTNIIPNDLELYEKYWIDQFSVLVNVRHNTKKTVRNTDVGERVRNLIRKKHTEN